MRFDRSLALLVAGSLTTLACSGGDGSALDILGEGAPPPTGPAGASGSGSGGDSAGPGGGGSAVLGCHDVCQTGTAQLVTCDACVEKVCNHASSCCTTKWDAKCVDWVKVACSKTCNAGGGSSSSASSGSGGSSASSTSGGATSGATSGGATSGGSTAASTSGGATSGDSTAASTSGGDPGPSCGELASQNGWFASYCEWNGNGACGGNGQATWDCDHCCEGPSCGEFASSVGWTQSACEWNGNGACGGQGQPTWDCEHCCGS